ncbi:MAG: bifunctional metallophosphatase/5'-nucleotidase [Bacilli bacterium]|nr:bifunctional metallophosphatase/5'-nucleotidase [Bacilli bacterium]
MQNSKKFVISCLVLFSLAACAGQNQSESLSSSDASVSSQASTTLDFYCVNDFHGSVIERMNGNYYEAGIEKCFGRLKELKQRDPEHTVILSAGDMFQGSFESNFNYGNFVTEAMNAVPFDAMTLGNHEFDYGIEKLLTNRDLAQFPMLAGNIRKVEGTVDKGDWEEFGSSFVLERGGCKIGIVGMIGAAQTTSITSTYVSTLDFADPESFAISESASLKAQGCNVVILTLHADSKELGMWTESKNLKKYFDGVFTGHSHRRNNDTIGGVRAVQSYCNGEAISHIQLRVRGDSVTTSYSENINSNKSWQKSNEISAVCDKYFQNETFLEKQNGVAGTLSGSFNPTTVTDFSAQSIYHRFIGEHPTLAVVIENKQRASVNTGTVTYSDLYKALPFTNHIVIADVPGRDILSNAKVNETYTGDLLNYGTLEPNQIYRIAVIDYLFYHQNEKKVFDYYPSLNTGEAKVVADVPEYPVDIAYDYFVNACEGKVSASDYGGGDHFNHYR